MSFRKILALSLVVTVIATSSAPAFAVTCFNARFGCTATTTVTVFTGSPTVICLNGYDVVEVTSSAACFGGSNAGPAVALRCGLNADPLVYSGGGKVHKVQPTTNWQDVVDGDCRKLAYKYANQ